MDLLTLAAMQLNMKEGNSKNVLLHQGQSVLKTYLDMENTDSVFLLNVLLILLRL